MERKFISKVGTAVIMLVLTASVVMYIFLRGTGGGALYAVVSAGDYPDIHLPLSVDTVFTLPHNPLVHIRIENGAAAITRSDCPDQRCVRAGPLQRAGQVKACLPNRVVVAIRGG